MTALENGERHKELIDINTRGIKENASGIQSILATLAKHEDREMRIWNESQDLYKQVGNSIIVLNHEMGEVVGKLSMMQWFMGGTTLAVIAGAIRIIFFPL